MQPGRDFVVDVRHQFLERRWAALLQRSRDLGFARETMRNQAPDFVLDRGHMFGTELSDEDKRALIEFLKTM